VFSIVWFSLSKPFYSSMHDLLLLYAVYAMIICRLRSRKAPLSYRRGK